VAMTRRAAAQVVISVALGGTSSHFWIEYRGRVDPHLASTNQPRAGWLGNAAPNVGFRHSFWSD
jgi:hypothetical protein